MFRVEWVAKNLGKFAEDVFQDDKVKNTLDAMAITMSSQIGENVYYRIT